MRLAWPAALLLALALAGCGGPKAVPAGIPVDEQGKALPTLQGVVVDDAIRPLAGATVRFLATGLNATTGEDGHYELRRPTLVAEEILVTASRDGYKTRTQQVQVSGHVSATMDFVLEVDPAPLPRVDVLQHTGQVRCLARTPLPDPLAGAQCERDRSDSGEHPVPPPWIWSVDPDVALAGAVVQLAWDPTTAGTQTLHAWLEAPVAGGQGGPRHAEVTGTSPLRLELPEPDARSLPRFTSIWVCVELPPGALGANVQQTVEEYASLFYVDPAPPGYLLA